MDLDHEEVPGTTDRKRPGEGDYGPGRRYRDDAQRLVEQGRHEACKPPGRDQAVDDEAGRAGRDRAEESDPAAQRDHGKPG